MDFDNWLALDEHKYPTHCDIHNEHKPCCYCRDEETDRQVQEYYDDLKSTA